MKELIILLIWLYFGCGDAFSAEHPCAPGQPNQICQQAIDQNKQALHRLRWVDHAPSYTYNPHPDNPYPY